MDTSRIPVASKSAFEKFSMRAKRGVGRVVRTGLHKLARTDERDLVRYANAGELDDEQIEEDSFYVLSNPK